MSETKSGTPVFFQDISVAKKLKLFIISMSKYIKQGDISNSSKIIVYYILLSLFPLVILIGNLLPLLHLNVDNVMGYVKLLFPKQVSSLLLPTIEKILSNGSSSLLSVGLVVAVWASSRGINVLRISVNRAYGVEDVNFYATGKLFDSIIRRTISFFITIFSVLMFGILTLIIIFGQTMLEWLIRKINLHQKFLEEFITWKWPIALVAILIASMFLYYFLPNVKVRIMSVIPGSVTTTLGVSLLTQFFSLYIRYFGVSWSSYGTIGAFIIFLLWMNASAIVFMFGAALNASFSECYYGDIIINKSKLVNLLKEVRNES